MKLAEALMLRADANKRLEQLKQRLGRNAKVQEGDKPAENPESLLTEFDSTLATFTRLVKKINKTNAVTMVEGTTSLSDAIAERDAISIKRSALTSFIEAASVKQDRYSRSEVKFCATFDIAALQKELDQLSKQYRELDGKIQQINWNVDLIEE